MNPASCSSCLPGKPPEHRTRGLRKRRALPAVFFSVLGACAVHALDLGNPAERAHHMRQVLAVLYLHAEKHVDDAVAVGALHRHVLYVRAGIGDRGREPGQKPALIVDENADAGLEHTLDLRRPLDIDDLIAFDAALAQRLAIARVNEQPLTATELTNDRIAGNRPATFAVLDRHALDAAQLQRAEAGWSLRRIVGRTRHRTRERLSDHKRQPLALTDVGEDVEA